MADDGFVTDQAVGTGVVPGNRNSDNINAMFQKHRYLMFPSKSIHTDGIRAGVMSDGGPRSSSSIRATFSALLNRPHMQHTNERTKFALSKLINPRVR